MHQETLFAEILLPFALPQQTLTYRVPEKLNSALKVGQRVVVPFRHKKTYSGIVCQIHTLAPKNYVAKYIIDLLDSEAIVTPNQLQFWTWLHEYYMCTMGEVMQVALPSSFKLSGESVITLNQNCEFDKKLLNDEEYLLIDALEIEPIISIENAQKILGKENLISTINSLIGSGIIVIAENIVDKVKPKLKRYIVLEQRYNDEKLKKELFAELERSPKQLHVLLSYIKLKPNALHGIERAKLLQETNVSASVLNSLVGKNIFIEYEKEVSRLGNEEAKTEDFKALTEQQKNCINSINKHFEQKEVVLIHGVTSSGKTHVYIEQIRKQIAENRQVLYLLPEIALTTQIVSRLKKIFGNRIGVFHSKYNDQEKAEIWKNTLKGDYDIILGARSALFLPFQNLGLIIVDEEHESSYKQQDPAPRYHARDAALYLARLHQAKAILGSATPSLESYYNAEKGKYGLVEMLERYSNAQEQDIDICDLKKEEADQSMQSQFSSALVQNIDECLRKKEQVILFHNRRGYVPILICKTCGHTPKCINCDVSLTHHKSTNMLHCHYCGYQQKMLHQCPVCGSTHVEEKGFGTEKIELELGLIFPNANIARLDYDSTKTKNGFQNIISQFEDQQIDILIGTQMVSKGLDFDNVTLVGVINADSMLRFPEFRAEEKSFQTLTQVAGRAGRRNKQGKILIQTYSPEHRVIQNVLQRDYKVFYNNELKDRHEFGYPPFQKLIYIDIKHKDVNQLNHSADFLTQLLKQHLAGQIIGPEFPLISRIKNYYIKNIIVKISPEQSLQKVKHYIRNSIDNFNAEKIHRSCIIQLDVDPY